MEARWNTASDPLVNWRFTNQVPNVGDGTRNRIKDGAAQWNALGQSMTFAYDGQPDYEQPAIWREYCGDDYQQDGVHWFNIDDSVALAEVYKCSSVENAGGTGGTQLHSFQIRFDSSRNWFTGSGTGIASIQYDLWSVAAHEFGHATGRGGTATAGLSPLPTENGVVVGDASGHFTLSTTYCNTNATAWHTMCAGVVNGTIWGRSLNTHDIDVFKGSY